MARRNSSYLVSSLSALTQQLFRYRPLRTFRISADPAHGATAFMLNRATALRASAPLMDLILQTRVVSFLRHVGLDGLGDRVGTGEYPVFTKTGREMAGYAEELLDDLAGLDAASPGEGNHPADRFALG